MAGRLCAIVETVKIVGTKPRLTILRYLEPDSGKEGGMGFNELARESGLSSRTLSLNLQYLAGKGVVLSRQRMNQKRYYLSKKGAELKPALKEIGDWGMRWHMFK